MVIKMLAAEIIKKKRNGFELSESEIHDFIIGYTKGEVPDYQMSALLMAIYFKGMTTQETLSLTKTMLHSGIVVDTSSIPGFKVDKHSTGGVGDKTSLILGPVVAACGVYVPMISGRGLGHTGGTLDKLESIPGFNTQQSLEEFVSITKEIGTCFIGQTKEICPADKKIYALRDVTATVESLPLICASIMSKKIAEGIDGLVLDVKFGSGAFMKSVNDAKNLAKNLMAIGQGYGKKVVAMITSMEQPLGRFAGNALEVYECVEIMKGHKHIGSDGYDLYEDTRLLSLRLSAEMIHLSGKSKSLDEAFKMAHEALVSGRALKIFQDMCGKQGGQLNLLPEAENKINIVAKEAGYLSSMQVEGIGVAGLQLKAGRARTDDVIDPVSGIEFHKKIGSSIKVGDIIYTVHGNDSVLLNKAALLLEKTYEISTSPLPIEKHHTLIKEILY